MPELPIIYLVRDITMIDLLQSSWYEFAPALFPVVAAGLTPPSEARTPVAVDLTSCRIIRFKSATKQTTYYHP